MARLEPMASTSSSVGLVRGHTCCPARVASCWRGRTCPHCLHGRCWFGHDDDLEEDPPCREVAATSCRDAATASDLLVRVRRLERVVDQIGCVLVPQIKKGTWMVLWWSRSGPSVPDLGAYCGLTSSCTTGARAESHA